MNVTSLAKLTGPVFQPDDAGYAEEVAGFQTAVRSEPAVVVGAATAADVVAAIRFATEHDLPVAVQATGHGLAVPADGGLLISTRRLDSVEIDPAAGTARVGAGVRWGAVIEAAAAHGLAPLSGSSPDVGVVGYTLSGGFGLMARRYGRAADHVRALDVVTPDGILRHVTPESDLFWALRGGRDNFGVVTSMEFGLVPVTSLYGGGLYFGTEHLAAVLRAWRDWSSDAPDEVTSSVALIPFPGLEAIPEPLRGKHIAHIRIAYLGSDGDKLVAPLRAAAPALMDTLDVLPFTASGSIASEPPHPHGYQGTNATVRELNDEMIDAILELAGPSAAVPTVLLIDLLGGELARPPAVPGVGWDSAAAFTVRSLSLVDEIGPDSVRRAHAKLFDALAPWSTGRLLSFLYGESGEPVYSGPDRKRLASLKHEYDPKNLFRLTHRIA
ncbi:MAG TPA: FAD-binding oxidoreductase [Amycolatopsis sp.]|nr:FAD-binding oxidoreductase [Amycolatopsis sp.]